MARKRSRVATRIGLGLGILVVLFVAVVVTIAVANPSALANRIAQQEVPKLSAQLGRPVSVGHIDIDWFPVQAVVHDVHVGGARGEPDLLDAPRVAVRPKLWPLLRSRGKDVEISSIHIDAPQVNLVRLADGSFDLPQGNPSAEPAPAQGGSREVSVGRISLEKGAIKLFAAGDSDQPLVALTQIHFTAGPVAVGAPLNLELNAAFGADKPNLHATLQLATVPAGLAELRAHPPAVKGALQLGRAQLERFRALLPESAQGLIQGGALSATANVSGGGERGKRLALAGSANLADVSLRGKPASGGFDWSAQLSPLNPSSAEVEVKNLKLQGPGVQLGGSATASLAAKRVRFALSGPLLDLDALLAALPQAPKSEAKSKPTGMTAQVRRQLEALDVSGTLAVQKVVVHAVQASDLDAQAKLEGARLVFPRARANLYGGTLNADQAEVDLSKPVPAWQLRAKLSGVDLGLAMQETSGQRPLNGRATGTIDLNGQGSAWDQLSHNLTGTGGLQIAQAALASGALGDQLAGPLRSVLPGAAGKTAAAAAKGTPLQNLGLGFAVRNGFLELTRPLGFDADFGKVSLNGRIGLDGRLDLTGTVALAPSFVSGIGGKALAPNKPVDLPVHLGGTLSHPALAPTVNGPALAARIAGASGAGKAVQGAKNAAQNAAKNIANQARRGLGGILRP